MTVTAVCSVWRRCTDVVFVQERRALERKISELEEDVKVCIDFAMLYTLTSVSVTRYVFVCFLLYYSVQLSSVL